MPSVVFEPWRPDAPDQEIVDAFKVFDIDLEGTDTYTDSEPLAPGIVRLTVSLPSAYESVTAIGEAPLGGNETFAELLHRRTGGFMIAGGHKPFAIFGGGQSSCIRQRDAFTMSFSWSRLISWAGLSDEQLGQEMIRDLFEVTARPAPAAESDAELEERS